MSGHHCTCCQCVPFDTKRRTQTTSLIYTSNSKLSVQNYCTRGQSIHFDNKNWHKQQFKFTQLIQCCAKSKTNFIIHRQLWKFKNVLSSSVCLFAQLRITHIPLLHNRPILTYSFQSWHNACTICCYCTNKLAPHVSISLRINGQAFRRSIREGKVLRGKFYFHEKRRRRLLNMKAVIILIIFHV